jgi:hypothetical protein
MPSPGHLSRFKILYLQVAIAIASSVGGELGVMKNMTPEEIAKLTWIFWTCIAMNVVITAGNNVLSSLHPPPPPSSEAQNQPSPVP